MITGKMLLELINLIKKILNINKSFCIGFSMGRYGIWRMSFLHLELFNEAIIVSGYTGK